jgi:hypothetical protein
MMFGFWIFLDERALTFFGMAFATYLTSVNATAGGLGRALYDIRSGLLSNPLLLASSFTFGNGIAGASGNTSTARRGWFWMVGADAGAGCGLLGSLNSCRTLTSMFAGKGGVRTRSASLSAPFFGPGAPAWLRNVPGGGASGWCAWIGQDGDLTKVDPRRSASAWLAL